jgi:uncharacterized protein
LPRFAWSATWSAGCATAAGGDRPVLLHRSPYDKQVAQSDLAYPHPARYAAHGYVVVAQDVRGRFGSDGDFYPFLLEAAFLATGEAVRRGDYGALDRLDGALLHAPEHYWADPAAFPELDGGLADYYRDWLAHPTYDDYWRRWSIDADYGRLTVPALHVGGLYDSFLPGTVRNFVGMRRDAGSEHARERQELLLAPFTDMPWWPVWDAGAAAGANAVDDWQLRYLDGTESGVFDHPVTVCVLGGGWRDFGDWPPPEASATDLFLHSDGRANTAFGDGSLSEEAPAAEPPDFYTYHPAAPAETLTLHAVTSATDTD